jgi:tetratricopeptide (TPR) repeat protein
MYLPQRFAVALAVLAGLSVPSVALACLWDYDTIKMERSRFPSTLELITGKFLRHSDEFYRWRIENRLRRLESDPADVALLDDLAVAYDKTGQHDRAIETALRAEKLHPGRYETAANLGTFYIHAGRLQEGVAHIDRALRMNPDAHFGREKYQKLLAEYVLRQRQADLLKLPLADVHLELPPAAVRQDPEPQGVTVQDTFADFLRSAAHEPLGPGANAAVKGILGMMKFGKHDAPVLLEALGTLLTQGPIDPSADAKLLAARAYLKASYEVPDGPARRTYRGMAARAIHFQTSGRGWQEQITLAEVEEQFQKELREAREWYAELSERERSWVRDGKDPEAEFDKLYAAEPVVSGLGVLDTLSAEKIILIVAGLALVVGLVVFVLVRGGVKKTRAGVGHKETP